MEFIKLKNSTEIAIVDNEDFDRLSKFEWRIDGRGNYVYRELNRYIRRCVSMPQEIFGKQYITFDHIDRNPLNNQKSNLRPVTHHQNMMNTTKRKRTTSKYKGVGWHKKSNLWRAYIQFNYKHIHIGFFMSEIEAAKAYNDRATELFKEFANLNKDDQGNTL